MADTERHYLTGESEVGEFPTIPAGVYTATLEGVTEEEHELYGTRWVWHWTVPEMHPDGGDFAQQVWTPPRFSSAGIASEMARALGASTSKGSKVDRGALRGKQALLTVTLDDEKGRNRVRGAVPATQAAALPQSTSDPEFAAWQAEKAAKAAAVAAANVEQPPPPSEPPGDAAAESAAA